MLINGRSTWDYTDDRYPIEDPRNYNSPFNPNNRNSVFYQGSRESTISPLLVIVVGAVLLLLVSGLTRGREFLPAGSPWFDLSVFWWFGSLLLGRFGRWLGGPGAWVGSTGFLYLVGTAVIAFLLLIWGWALSSK